MTPKKPLVTGKVHRCATCRWSTHPDDQTKDEYLPDGWPTMVGECRRNPPRETLELATGAKRGKFPNVRGDDWCGEWECWWEGPNRLG